MENLIEKLTVVIIEDNQGDFVLIEDYLIEKFKSIEIVHFSDFESSSVYLQNPKSKVSLILLDLFLPDLGGDELIHKISDSAVQVPIVILTGYSDVNLAKESLQLGVYDYLIKDEVNPNILHKTILYALHRSNYINQIREEKLNYENLFNFNPQPTWLLDSTSLRILNANMAAQKKYGYTLEAFLDMTFNQLHPSEENQLIKNSLISEEGNFAKRHFTHLLSNDNEIKVEIYCREISSTGSSSFIVQINDVSETMEHISTIEIQNSKLKKIAWTQSHLVRAPLSRILGIINMLEDRPDSLEEVWFWLQQLRVSTEEMDEMVKKIVDEANRFDKE
jgi:PAS domain S-box-containing protein